ncbi:hypothetical protein ACFLY3_02360 [Chloroflexota bacterium]
MYQPSFNGCWAKINRAKEHRDALDVYIGEFFSIKANRSILSAKFDANKNENIIYISKVPDLSPFLTRVALYIGDITHNLRSALDYLAFQLTLYNKSGNLTPKEEGEIQFPIISPSVSDPQKEFMRKSKRHLKYVDPTHVATIERLQPYHGLAGRPDGWSGDYIHQLDLLRNLSDKDKHRMLTPILTLPSRSEFISGAGGVGDIVTQCIVHNASSLMAGNLPGDSPRLEEGAVILSSPITQCPISIDVDVAGYVTPSINLSEGGALIPTIDRITTFVEYIIREFEPLF